MSVVSVTRLGDERQGSFDEKGIRKYTEVFRVITNDPQDGQVTVLSAVGLRRGSLYIFGNDVDMQATCKSGQAQPDQDDDRVWKVRYEFTTEQGDQNHPDNPLDKPAEVSWQFNSQRKLVSRDRNGNPLVNKANRPFPPQEIDDDRCVFTIKKNFASFDPSLVEQFTNSVNASAFMGMPAGTVKCGNITAPPAKTENDVEYVEVTGEFEYRREGWAWKPLNAGLAQLKPGTTNKWVPCKDSDGQPVSEPVPLDNDGHQLAPNYTPDDLKYLSFDLLDEAEFNNMGFV